MPSKNMLPKGKRRQTVKPAYRAHRQALRDAEALPQPQPEHAQDAVHAATPGASTPQMNAVEEREVESPEFEVDEDTRSFEASANASGKRLDAYLAKALPDISRARVQLLIDHGQVRVNGEAARASLKLAGGERIEIEGEPQPAPLKAEPEDIPLTIVYEDDDLAVIDKPAGMTVHAGAGDAEHNRGTLVNALLFHFGSNLSQHPAQAGQSAAQAPRPGIVHRLDKETSGLILVAKNDVTHRKLADMFADRALRKVYLALVHGSVLKDEGTIDLPIGRDPVRRIRMTTRRSPDAGARPAVSHWRVLERLRTAQQPGPLGAFTLVEMHIETGRTHQIRVHLAALGHPVVGDTLYGAPNRLRRVAGDARKGRSTGKGDDTEPTLARNFLHAAELSLKHPRRGKRLDLRSPLPPELEQFLAGLRDGGAE